ncbi:MutS domain III [Bacteroides luti]|uniref:MutS domain III n=2 Tax=Bacteroides luti TaxID=1297750 RepID=A0A1M5DE95_9BACE|nr:MutS domain III [Bacteroides luti]
MNFIFSTFASIRIIKANRMSNLEKISNTYKQIIKETQGKLTEVKKKIYRISTIRVLLFIAGVTGVIYFFTAGWLSICGVIACTFVPFLALVKHHNRLFYKKDYLEKKIGVNQQELSAIDYNFSAFDDGKEFINSAHLYSYDLDLFGNNSLFQYINRTSTLFGKNLLADWFNNHLKNKDLIEKRQEAVRELAPELRFRQRFRILGLLYKGDISDGEKIKEWAESKSLFKENRFLRTLTYIVPAVNFIILALAIAGIVSFNLLGASFVFFVICSMRLSNRITKVQISYGKKLQILTTYAGLIEMIEKFETKSKALQEVKQMLGKNEKSASVAVNKLAKLMNALDQRNNILVTALLNGFLFWELRQIIKIESWKEEHADKLPVWLKAVGEIDALCSLSTFAFNHPGYNYPVINNKPFALKVTEMGHPLMNRSKCIKNDVDIPKRPYFVIITGANMAGKSTYLRTIGVNYLLACIGSPVCAKEMEIYPAQLITSLRTTDSLTDNESYFFAELKRLKLIIDKLENKEELFIILDEILKGTNSMDKQKGSFALIKQFMSLNANGIIATHDLLLGSLIDHYPEDISNYCFEAEVKDNELNFSYLLKDGVAQNMNACFLMKKMGIAVIDS